MAKTPLYDPQIDAPIWGARNIASVINRNPRQTFHLLEKGFLDADKVGSTWTSSIRRLLLSSSERRRA
jgi:hypothetical protein